MLQVLPYFFGFTLFFSSALVFADQPISIPNLDGASLFCVSANDQYEARIVTGIGQNEYSADVYKNNNLIISHTDGSVAYTFSQVQYWVLVFYTDKDSEIGAYMNAQSQVTNAQINEHIFREGHKPVPIQCNLIFKR